MNFLTPWINTILLVFILWYQWNKNRTLSDRINQQSRLLQETKSAVTQQATALESQAVVVETAIRYSEAFDPEKLEQVLRKQVEAETAQKIVDLEQVHKKGLSEKETKHKDQLMEMSKKTIEATTKTWLVPLMKLIVSLMFMVPSAKREELIDAMDENPVREQMKTISTQIDEASREALARELKKIETQQSAPTDAPPSQRS